MWYHGKRSAPRRANVVVMEKSSASPGAGSSLVGERGTKVMGSKVGLGLLESFRTEQAH